MCVCVCVCVYEGKGDVDVPDHRPKKFSASRVSTDRIEPGSSLKMAFDALSGMLKQRQQLAMERLSLLEGGIVRRNEARGRMGW